METHANELTERIIGCIITVHKTLGPGFLETIYQRALAIELKKAGLIVESEREAVVLYDGQEVGRHRLDLVVEREIVVELKAIEALSKAHDAQLRSYLKAAGLRLGLLVNFSGPITDFRRVDF